MEESPAITELKPKADGHFSGRIYGHGRCDGVTCKGFVRTDSIGASIRALELVRVRQVAEPRFTLMTSRQSDLRKAIDEALSSSRESAVVIRVSMREQD